MLTAARDKLSTSLAHLRRDPLPAPLRAYRDTLETLLDWVEDYLCKPHPSLGRTGPVCPFTAPALEQDLLTVSFFPGVRDAAAVREIVRGERDIFLSTEPRRGNTAQFKCFLLLFPDIDPDDINTTIDAAQASLQESFVSRGLMVGEFHSGPPDKRGLWNAEFRPLACPVPLLAIRHMVPTDILFLKDKSTLVADYLRQFGDMVPGKMRHLVEEAAERFGFDLPEKTKGSSSAPTVIYYLQKHGVPYRLHRHAEQDREIERPEDFAAALGYDVARISKALFVCDRDSDTYAILVLGATRKADLTAVARLLGCGRLTLAGLDELSERVGHPPKAVTPIGLEEMPTFIDRDLMGFETILTGAGVPRMEIELSPDDLVALSRASICDLAIGSGL